MMISVVIPLYNKASHIAKTLECVLAQTYADYEIVVVNDGSTDNSAEIVRSFSDPRVRLIDQPNGGVSSARNRGTQEATGEYVAYLDADDEWEPDYLATQMSLVEKYPYCDVFVVNYRCCDINGSITYPIINNLPFTENDGELTNYFIVASSSHPPICSITIMVRREAMLAKGGFPGGVPNGEERMTWARLAVRYRIAYSKSVKATYMLKAGHGVNSKPVNIPPGNVVGSELEKLLVGYKGDVVALRNYIGRWYKIRSHIFLRGGERYNAFVNIIRTIKYKPKEWKIYMYLCFLPFPNSLVNYVFKRLGS